MTSRPTDHSRHKSESPSLEAPHSPTPPSAPQPDRKDDRKEDMHNNQNDDKRANVKGDKNNELDKFWQLDPTCAEAIYDESSAHLAKTSTEYTKSHSMKAVVVCSDRLWKNGIVLDYAFIDKAPYSSRQLNQQKKVRDTITEWELHANVKFRYISDYPNKPAVIRIAFDGSSGSWSFVGKEVSQIKLDEPTMNLGWVSGDDTIITPSERGVILHEFGHTLGLMHEHQSPARGKKLTLKRQAVIDFYTDSQHWDAEEVESQILKVYNAYDISNYSELDVTSIMMYFMPAAMNEEGIKISPNNKLSDMDKAFMTINYPPSPTNTAEGPAAREKFERALDIVGVDGDEKTSILKLYDAMDWDEVRYEFTKFCTETRAARKAAQGAKQPSTVDPEEIPTIDCCGTDDLLASSKPSGAPPKGVAIVDKYLWLPGDKVTYTFTQGSLDATPYRKKRVEETFAEYALRSNLTFEEVPSGPIQDKAHLHFYFGPCKLGVTGWSMVGKTAIGFSRTQSDIENRGGSVNSSIVLTDVVPKLAPTDETAIKREKRTLYHEIGHSLGLLHEHESPNTKTLDRPDPSASVATVFDEHSVMLYPKRVLKKDPMHELLDPQSTKFNHLPSKLDLAFIGAVYPYGKGHVNDRFDKDVAELGLAADLKALSTQRDLAFSYLGTPEFATNIFKLRLMLKDGISKLTAAKSAKPVRGIVLPGPTKSRAVAAPATPTTGSFLDELVKTLSALFKPTSGQLFALQFPGRFLQQEQFAWDTSSAGIYGQFVKPTVVNESEFRLVDQLYNVGTVIGAPSGINLSIVYEQVLNNLVPGIQPSQIKFSRQQDQIRKWLMKDVQTGGWVNDLINSQHTSKTVNTPTSGSGRAARAIHSSSAVNPDAKPQFAVANKLSDDNKVNRMELAEALMHEYLAAKQAWELERDDMIKNAKGEDLDALTRKLAHITAIRESQLASKHADAVVRGYSHVIRQYLGYMDIKTPAEILQDAKDALRESAVSSLDGSMKIFPVQMQPIDWFQSLSTSFTMEDLTTNPELILQQIDSKSKQLDTLQTRVAVMQSKPKVDIKELQARLDAAQDAYDRAVADLSTTYTSNVISLARTCINASNEFVKADFLKSASASNIAEAAFSNIEVGMKKLTDAQVAITKSSRALTQLMAAKSIAEASDTAQEVIEINIQITAITRDIAELTSRLQSLRYKPNPSSATPDSANPVSLDNIPLYPTESGSSGGSRWQEVLINHELATKYTATSNHSGASANKTDLSLFFGSYHSESGRSSSGNRDATSDKTTHVEVGFRATMVTVDRGGWFQPQFFKQSAGFHCIDKNISWSKWPENINSIHDLSNIGSKTKEEATKACEFLNKSLLPAFPTGFIVCKDITIKIHMSSTEIESEAAEMENFAATSAGILCFSTSSSDQSKSSEKSYGFQKSTDGCVIRIPGPQIMGYMLQFTDKDETTEIPDILPDGFLVPDADYNSSFVDKPLRDVVVPPLKEKAVPEPVPKV